MPIISRCGARSLKTRAVYSLVFMILSLGAVTMVYPLLLMVAGSFKSDTDFAWISPVPQYWFNDDVLWMKFIEQKYGNIAGVETAYHRPVGSWRKLRPPTMTDQKLC